MACNTWREGANDRGACRVFRRLTPGGGKIPIFLSFSREIMARYFRQRRREAGGR